MNPHDHRETSKRRYMLSANAASANVTDWLERDGPRARSIIRRIPTSPQKRYAAHADTTFCRRRTADVFEHQTQSRPSVSTPTCHRSTSIKTFAGDCHAQRQRRRVAQRPVRMRVQAGVAWRPAARFPTIFAMTNLNYRPPTIKDRCRTGRTTQTQSDLRQRSSWRGSVDALPDRHRPQRLGIGSSPISKNTSFFYPSVGLSAVVSDMVEHARMVHLPQGARVLFEAVGVGLCARYLTNPAYSDYNGPDARLEHALRPLSGQREPQAGGHQVVGESASTPVSSAAQLNLDADLLPFGHLPPDLRIDPFVHVGLFVGTRAGRSGPQFGSRNAAELP